MLKAKSICAFMIGIFVWSACATQAEAGPLLDWLTGRNRRRAVAQTPYCGLQPGQCQTTCQQTCTRTVVNYVPYTAYRACWKRVPVTQYRPVTSSDPCTGCTVTCMKPCTTYTWQQQRVPYTTYRPVYRQQTYRVPVTYITQAAPACNTCPPAGYGTAMPTTTMAPASMGCPSCATTSTPLTTMPSGTLNPGGSYTSYPATTYQEPTPAAISTPSPQSPTPADTPPRLKPSIPDGTVIQRREVTGSSYQARPTPDLNGVRPLNDPTPSLRWDENTAPALIQSDDKTAMSPVRKRFEYSPIKLASYQKETAQPPQAKTSYEFHGNVEIESAQPPKVNSMWKSKSW